MKSIYLDYNATTPLDPGVIEAMKPYLYEHFGNPSSAHPYGVAAKKAVEKARLQVATMIGCSPSEIVFTSGGTESNNYAIKGAALAYRARGNHIITSAVEHPAVLEVCNWLQQQGFRISVLPVDATGMVSPADLGKAIDEDTLLVTIMHANNEVGTIQPIAELTHITHQRGALFHTDAAQSVGKIPVDVKELGVDLLSIAGHKVYAPKGVGALYIRQGLKLEKLLHGASHESGRRPGTENVLEIVGLGEACEIGGRYLQKNTEHYRSMRDRLHQKLNEQLTPSTLRLNGHPDARLPNTLSLSFHKIEANKLLEDIAAAVSASAGAACHADQVEISSVLKALHVAVEWAMGTVRFSTGRATTADDIDKAADVIIEAVQKMRSSPVITL